MSNNFGFDTKEVVPDGACGQPTECYSRCCGYFRPVKNWNHGKKEEFKDRKTFNVKQAAATCGCYSKVK